MRVHRLAVITLLMMTAGVPFRASGQGRPNPAVLIEAQRKAMTRLAFMDGVWRGTAWNVQPSGEKHVLDHTERIGPFLDGSVKMIEGRGYNPDGKVGFNALGIISYSPDKSTYSMRSYALGNVGDFPLTPTTDGFVWEFPAGPATIRYTAVIKDSVWREIGERIFGPDKGPVRFFEMNLTRVGDTSWPAGGAIEAK